MMPEDAYIGYESERDVVFVLGAGSSYSAGVPLQKDIMPKILELDDDIKQSSMGLDIREFILHNFSWNSSRSIYPSLEDVFGLLDYLIERQESLGNKFTDSHLVLLREKLIKLIHYSIGSSTEGHQDTHREFCKGLGRFNTNICVINMNYDTLLDEAFDVLYPSILLIDYCLPLMNFDSEGDTYGGDWWVNPREPVRIYEGKYPRPIKLLKIHGSLNWKYCNCCNQVLLTPWNTYIDLKTGKFKRPGESDGSFGYFPYEYLCPRDNTPLSTLIMPPSHMKPLSQPVINILMNETAHELRICKKIVFIGYSFPSADIHIRALLKQNIRDNVPIVVIDRLISEGLIQSYRALSANIDYKEAGFEEVVRNKTLMQQLLTV